MASPPGARTWAPRVRRLIALALVTLLVVAGLAWPRWLPLLGTSLAVEDPLRPADAIVVTYSVMTRWGLPEASRLYREGWAKTVVLSDFESEAPEEDHLQPAARRVLAREGVPEEAMVSAGEISTSELDEARALRRLLDRQGWRSAIVVYREFRGFRARGTLQGAFRAAPVQLIMRPVPAPRVNLARWWTNRDGVNALMNEWPRVLYYWARGRF